VWAVDALFGLFVSFDVYQITDKSTDKRIRDSRYCVMHANIKNTYTNKPPHCVECRRISRITNNAVWCRHYILRFEIALSYTMESSFKCIVAEWKGSSVLVLAFKESRFSLGFISYLPSSVKIVHVSRSDTWKHWLIPSFGLCWHKKWMKLFCHVTNILKLLVTWQSAWLWQI
jgi:hypothetical protein